MFVGLELGSYFIDGMWRSGFVGCIKFLVKPYLKLTVFLHLQGFFFIETIILLVLAIDVIFGKWVNFGDVLSFEIF